MSDGMSEWQGDPTPRERLRARLARIVEAVDAGRYLTPGDAADAVLDVICSATEEHRRDVIVVLSQAPLPVRLPVEKLSTLAEDLGASISVDLSALPGEGQIAYAVARGQVGRGAGVPPNTAGMLLVSIENLVRLLADSERREQSWSDGVAELVEPFGFDRDAASGPADLLPGLVTARHRVMVLDLFVAWAVEAIVVLCECREREKLDLGSPMPHTLAAISVGRELVTKAKS